MAVAQVYDGVVEVLYASGEVWRKTVTLLASIVILSGSALAQEVVTRGDVVGDSPLVTLRDVMSDVDAYLDKTVTVEGSVGRVCQMKGCWMELAAEADSPGVRVTFKDYGFFVPTDSQGRAARLEGVFETNVFSTSDADHLIEEGVELTRNPDGTATELSFVAAGVELLTSE